MAHPKNKRERLEIGNRKGKKRAGDIPEPYLEKQIHLHRDTTKCCGGMCCKNERKVNGTKTIQERKAEIED